MVWSQYSILNIVIHGAQTPKYKIVYVNHLPEYCPVMRISPASPNFGQAKQGQKFVVPTFHIHFLNPECVRIPWVLAPKNFPVENFRVQSDLQKKSIFH